MIDRTLCQLGVTVALCSFAVDSGAERPTDTLQPIVQCVERGSFKVMGKSRLPEQITSRSVATSAGERRVSMADGYRVLLATKPGAPFVNLKIERSRDGFFAEDRAAVLAQMQTFSDRKSPEAKALHVTVRDGIEIMALDQPSIDISGPIGFYTLLSTSATLVATAYILSQAPDVRAFKTMAEYESLRDKFVDELASCLRQGGA